MKTQISLVLVSLLAVVGIAQAAPVVQHVVSTRPNVIFIKTDDQRFDSLSMTGHPVTRTPNIDALAKEGVWFENAFITSPICGPSRANFFTGQWERKNRVGFANVSKNFISNESFDNSWLMQLKRAGYFAGYIGKHHTHIGEINERNRYMQESLDFCYMKSGHLGFDLMKWKQFQNLKHSSQIEGLFEATDAFIRPGKDKDYFFENADASVKDFLQQRDPDKPFCLSINFNLPHAASIGGMGSGPTDPEMYRTLYSDQADDFVFPAGYPNIEVPLPNEVFRQSDLMKYYRTTNRRKLLDEKTKMARAVAGIDLFVGNLRQVLDEMDLAGNTILVFISDHGLLLGEHGLGGKTFLYEESIRVPLIFYSPYFEDNERGKTIDKLVVGQDVPATMLELCGLPIPSTYQGKSLLPLIQGRQVSWREDVFCENLFTDQGYPRMEAVRGKQWKYIRYFSREHDRTKYLPEASINGEQPIYEELFDLKSDPQEQKNLANLPEYESVLKEHRARCQVLVTELAK
ncbi:MAG: sulfatase-like hydrolase/transferase [Rubripirellula sp.]